MNKILTIVAFSILLSACGEDADNVNKTQVAIQPATSLAEQQVGGSRAVYLPDGTGLMLSGKMVKVADKGKFRRHEVAFDNSAQAVESSLYDVLSKAGYSRKVIETRDGFSKVHYYKDKTPVIGGVFQDSTSSAGQSHLSLYWQET
ncbi:hypothetical protein A6723_009200 [Pseudomonas sp. AU11447]|uniref:hypothetical protein n=1 Tax=unclassified Pseudomonas TaxID=196821 RepID=UPI0006D3D016|nr:MULTISPECIES: hypothetical protein [unclassified Pseudomonas]OBY93323.1 hypothetical protein A6723_009200 [Pseudomonas sp. AU11447]